MGYKVSYICAYCDDEFSDNVACPECVHAWEHHIENANARIEVITGKWCEGNRAEGRGGCGICPHCAKETRDNLTHVTILLREARMHLPEALLTRVDKALEGL